MEENAVRENRREKSVQKEKDINERRLALDEKRLLLEKERIEIDRAKQKEIIDVIQELVRQLQ